MQPQGRGGLPQPRRDVQVGGSSSSSTPAGGGADGRRRRAGRRAKAAAAANASSSSSRATPAIAANASSSSSGATPAIAANASSSSSGAIHAKAANVGSSLSGATVQADPDCEAWAGAAPSGADGPAAASAPRGSAPAAASSAAAAAGDPAAEQADLERLLEQLAPVEGCRVEDWASKMELLRGNVWRLATSKEGSHLLQLILVNAPMSGKVALAAELRGHVNEAWEVRETAQHANHVFQKFIEVMPPDHCAFVRDEMMRVENIQTAAHNTYGCRIMQRIIEHFEPRHAWPLVSRLLDQGVLSQLITSRYGNYVIQCILEHGEQSHKRVIARVLMQSPDYFQRVSMDRYGSHVVERAFLFCSEPDRAAILGLISSFDSRTKKGRYGSFVSKLPGRSGIRTRESQAAPGARAERQDDALPAP